MRKLEVSVAGRWFLVLTVLLGVVALVSGNNVLYLTESLLLSGLILSGVLSERTIAAVEVTLQQVPSAAGEDCRDRIIVKNRRRSPIFCIDLIEWTGRRSTVIAFVARLGPYEEITVSARRRFENRGWHRWDGFGVATSYPFGFARKLRLWNEAGERRIWPERATQGKAERHDHGKDLLSEGEVSEGEIRPFTPEDDPRLIVWRLSARGGDPVVRQRRSQSARSDPKLDLRTDPGAPFEAEIVRAARVFYAGAGGRSESTAHSLTLLGHDGSRKILGRSRALDELATIEPEGARP